MKWHAPTGCGGWPGETGLGEKSLYKSMRAGASPEFNTVLRVLRSLGFQLQVHPVAGSTDE